MGRQPAGTVGIVSQSGGLGIDMIRRGVNRGVRFSGVVTVGNCADLGPSDLLEFYLADPDTKVVGLYLETARDGRRLFEILRSGKACKPVVILKGGRTQEGTAAAASHTGSLAGDDRAWLALSRQTGCVLVDTLDGLLDALLAFQMLMPNAAQPLTRVALFGNGGGTSVLATDHFSRLGLKVSPFDQATIDALDRLGLPPGSSIINPVDCPAGNLRKDAGIAERVLEVIYSTAKVEAAVMHLNMTNFVGDGIECLDRLLQAALRAQTLAANRVHFALVLRSDGEPRLEELKHRFRGQATASGIPVYDELSAAGQALAAVRFHECFRRSRMQEGDGDGTADLRDPQAPQGLLTKEGVI